MRVKSLKSDLKGKKLTLRGLGLRKSQMNHA